MKSATFAFICCVICAASAADAAEPVLLADTNSTPSAEGISSVVSLGERIVFTRPVDDVTQVFAIDGTSVVQLAELPTRETAIFAAEGLAILATVRPSPSLITDGTPQGTREAQIGRSVRAFTKLDDRWVFWEELVGDHVLWSLSADGELTRLTTQPFLPKTESLGGLAFFMGTSCELLATDGYEVQQVLGPVEPVMSGPIPICEVSRFGRDELLIHRRDTNRVWVTEEGRTQLRSLDWIDYGSQFTSAANGALVWDLETLRFTDGTEPGTIHLQSLFSTPLTGAFLVGDRSFLQPSRGGFWSSDGTVRGTSRVTRSPPVGPLTTDGSFVYWTAADGAIWRIDADSTTKQVGAVPAARVRGTAATSNGVYVWDDLYIWRLTEESGVAEVWPADFPVRTSDAEPGEFVATESFVVFLSKQGSEFEEPPRARWQTYGTPETTTTVGNLPPRSRVIAALPNDRLLVDDGTGFSFWTPNGVTDVEDRRELVEGEANFGLTGAISGAIHTYVHDIMFHVQYVDIVVSIVDGASVRSISRIRVSTPETLEPFTFWIAEDGKLVVNGQDTCRRWTVSPEDGATEFTNDTNCVRAGRVQLRNGDLEVRQDGVWFVDGETERSIQGGFVFSNPVAVEGLGYFFRLALDGSEELELAQTDGTNEGTTTAFRAEGSLRGNFLRAHRGVVYVRTIQPSRLYAIVPGREAVAVTPESGDGAMLPFSGIAFLGNTAIYAGEHAEYGSEPFAVEIPLNDPDRFDDEANDVRGELTGRGCTSAPAEGPGALVLVLMCVLGAIRRRS